MFFYMSLNWILIWFAYKKNNLSVFFRGSTIYLQCLKSTSFFLYEYAKIICFRHLTAGHKSCPASIHYYSPFSMKERFQTSKCHKTGPVHTRFKLRFKTSTEKISFSEWIWKSSSFCTVKHPGEVTKSKTLQHTFLSRGRLTYIYIFVINLYCINCKFSALALLPFYIRLSFCADKRCYNRF